MRPFLTRQVMTEAGCTYEVCLSCNEFFPPVVKVAAFASEIKADMLTRRLNDLCEDFGTRAD